VRGFNGATVSGFAAGDTIDISGGGELTGMSGGGGTLQFDTGTFVDSLAQLPGIGAVVVDAGAVLELLDGGTLSTEVGGTGTVELPGPRTFTLASGAAFAVREVVQGAPVALAASVAIEVQAGAIWDMRERLKLLDNLSGGSGSIFTNAGLFEGNGPGSADVSVAFVNEGKVAILSGALKFLGPLTNDGTMIAGPTSTLQIAQSIAGSGVIDVGSAGTVALDAGAGSGTTVDFLTNNGLLDLRVPIDFGGTIKGFVNGDGIDLLKTLATSVSFRVSVLTVRNGSATVAELHFAGSYTTASFHLSSDSHGGTLII
jgi:hypothetical protein